MKAARIFLRALLALAAFAAPGRAQQPDGVVLTGVVRDAATGAPVVGALVSVGERGPRAIANAEGVFRLAGVPTGTQRIRVQRFGYHDVELSVAVTEPPAPLDVRMQVDPVALEGLTVTGGARVALGGTVVNAATEERVPWAELAITRDAVKDLARAAADGQGVFSLDDVTTGPYLLRVTRVGYVSQYLPVDVLAPPVPVEVRLVPDSALLAGLAVFQSELTRRRSGSGSAARSWGEARLRLALPGGMRRFLENDAQLNLVPCEGRIVRNDCRTIRGSLTSPRVYIDELPAFGLDELDSYEPYELFRVDVFECGPGDRLRGWEVRVYTYAYVERQATRKRQLIPTCFAY